MSRGTSPGHLLAVRRGPRPCRERSRKPFLAREDGHSPLLIDGHGQGHVDPWVRRNTRCGAGCFLIGAVRENRGRRRIGSLPGGRLPSATGGTVGGRLGGLGERGRLMHAVASSALGAPRACAAPGGGIRTDVWGTTARPVRALRHSGERGGTPPGHAHDRPRRRNGGESADRSRPPVAVGAPQLPLAHCRHPDGSP